MRLVIDISDDDYRKAQDGRASVSIMRKSIANGTPLPEGHGRLIDVNDLLDDIGLEDNGYNRDVNTGEIITLENIDRIPTIIEADKERSDKSCSNCKYWLLDENNKNRKCKYCFEMDEWVAESEE